jgi:hypothetical protein
MTTLAVIDALFFLARPAGLEPTAFWFKVGRLCLTGQFLFSYLSAKGDRTSSASSQPWGVVNAATPALAKRPAAKVGRQC